MHILLVTACQLFDAYKFGKGNIIAVLFDKKNRSILIYTQIVHRYTSVYVGALNCRDNIHDHVL